MVSGFILICLQTLTNIDLFDLNIPEINFFACINFVSDIKFMTKMNNLQVNYYMHFFLKFIFVAKNNLKKNFFSKEF